MRSLPWPRFDNSRSAEFMMREYLLSRDLSYRLARAQGWYPSTDAGDGLLRIIIPAVSRIPGFHYWQARAMSPDVRLRYRSPLVNRQDALIVLYDQRTAIDHAVICEGPMDALAAYDIDDVQMAIALMGNQPSEIVWSHALDLLKGAERISVLADSDALDATTQWLTRIARTGTDFRLVLPDPYKDFADMPRHVRVQKVK